MGDELIKRVPAFPSSADDGPGVTQWMDPRLLFERQRAREGQRPRRVDTAYRGGRKRGVRPSAAPWLEDFFFFFFLLFSPLAAVTRTHTSGKRLYGRRVGEVLRGARWLSRA